MKRFSIITLSLAASACASGPAPSFINGNYYLAGDSNCKRYNILTADSISCFNSKGQSTGYRQAMNSEQMQMYAAQQAYETQQIKALTQQMQQTGETFKQAGQAIQQTPAYTPPEVMNPAQPSNTVKCIKAGIYVNCRK